jgi:hypothetical protein
VFAAAPLLPVKFINRSNEAAENGFAIHGPYPFEDGPQGFDGIFTPQLRPADPFVAHKGS